MDWEKGQATATVEHFSTYVLLNKKEFDTVWNEEIRKPGEDATIEEGISISFVLDRSLSMSWNDSNHLRLTLTKQFIEKLEENKDLGSVISFIANAEVLTELTNDVEELKNAVDLIVDDSGYNYNSGTNGSAGIHEALQQLINDESGNSRYIIFMTDGADNVVSHSYESLIETAQMNGVTIFTVGLGSVNAEILQQLADGTGGKYYYASAAEELTDIFKETEKETIDFHKDSNGDDISDYHTRILCESGLYINGTRNPFAGYSYSYVQSKYDFDGDGLSNGEEIEVKEYNGLVRVVMKSDPTTAYSDTDMYTDWEEIKIYNTDPMRKNFTIRDEHAYFLVDGKGLLAEQYLHFYENDSYGWAERASIWIGNNIFNTNYDTVYLYKCALMESFIEMQEESLENQELYELVDFISPYLTAVSDSLNYIIEVQKDINEKDIEDLQSAIETAKKNMSDVKKIMYGGVDGIKVTKDEVYGWLDSVNNKIDDFNKKNKIFNNKANFYKKIGNTVRFFSASFEITDWGVEFKHFSELYSVVTANIVNMQKGMEILELVSISCDDAKLTRACKEMSEAIKKQVVENNNIYWATFQQMGDGIACRATAEVVKKILESTSVKGYIILIEVILGVGDYVFKFSDIAEASSYLYAIAKTTNIYSEYMSRYLTLKKWNEYLVVYEDVESASMEFYNQAFLRKCSEWKMRDVIEAYPLVTELWLSKYIYEQDKMITNMAEISYILSRYWGIKVEWRNE